MTLFLVLALIALNRDKPSLSWVLYTLALLTKLQSIVLLPLLVILTLRRYDGRVLAGSIGICGVLVMLVLLPFIAVSGFDATLRPYLSAAYPVPTTVNAFNIWSWHPLSRLSA